MTERKKKQYCYVNTSGVIHMLYVQKLRGQSLSSKFQSVKCLFDGSKVFIQFLNLLPQNEGK